MDFQRRYARKSQWFIWGLLLVLLIGVVIMVPMVTSRLFPQYPSVDRRSVVVDTVRRGEFVHEVRCVGQLVSEDITVRPAKTQARVQRIVALPGVIVDPDTLIVELENFEIERALTDAKWKLGAAEATLITEEARFERDLLQLEMAWQQHKYAHMLAEGNYQVLRELRTTNPDAVARQRLEQQRLTAESSLHQRDLAKMAYERVRLSRENHLAVYREEVKQAKTNIQRSLEDLQSLKILAGVHGTLAQVPLTVGQQVELGELVAKIVDPRKLKAELRAFTGHTLRRAKNSRRLWGNSVEHHGVGFGV